MSTTPFLLFEATLPTLSQFDPKDVSEIRITIGDANNDGMIDVRVRVFAKVPFLNTEPTQQFCLGPFNVPIEEALKFGSDIVKTLPAVAAPIAGMAIGIAAGATGSLQHLLGK